MIASFFVALIAGVAIGLVASGMTPIIGVVLLVIGALLILGPPRDE